MTLPAMLKLAEVKRCTGYARSTLYDHAQKGLFPRPVKMGDSASAWPDYEVKAVIAARMAGKSKAAIRQLVQKLHAQRQAANEG